MKMRRPKGTGSYRQLPNGTYQWRQRIDGEERTATGRTPKELQEKVKLIADLPIIKEKYKVSEWFEKWLKVYVQPLKKTATYNQYYFLYTKHIKPVLGKRKMTTIKSIDIQSVISKMNSAVMMPEKLDDKGNVIKEAKIGASEWTMKHARKVMKLAFEKAFKEKIIPANPVVDIEIPKKQAKARKVLSPTELSKLYAALETSRWIWSAKFMLVTGVRRGELLALRWSDIDFENKRITIDESDSSTGLGDTKTRIHYVPLSDKAKEYLDKQKEMLRSESNPILFNAALKKTDLIFPNKYGKMLNANSYYTVFARAAEKAGIKASPHCMRHTFVYLHRTRLSLKELQNILGHDESTTTLDIYGDIINESTAATIKSIDEVFNQLDDEIEKIETEKEKVKGKVIQFRAR